nr:BCCT family transporter [Lentibacillus salicampi]
MKKKETYMNPVFFISAIIVGLLVIIGAFMPEQFGTVAQTLFDFTTVNFGWLYLLAVFIIIVFLVSISISKHGKTRLGASDSRPEYPFLHGLGCCFPPALGYRLYSGVLPSR